MSDKVNPSKIIFVNDDLSDQVKGVLVAQLEITQVLSGADFDAKVLANPNFTNQFKLDPANGSLLVIRSLRDQTNRQLCDYCLFVKNGMASVLYQKSGRPERTLSITALTLASLINTKNSFHNAQFPFHNHPFGCCCSNCLYFDPFDGGGGLL